MGVDLFVEQDWTRYLDFLRELPGRIVMRFEFGDPKQIRKSSETGTLSPASTPSAF